VISILLLFLCSCLSLNSNFRENFLCVVLCCICPAFSCPAFSRNPLSARYVPHPRLRYSQIAIVFALFSKIFSYIVRDSGALEVSGCCHCSCSHRGLCIVRWVSKPTQRYITHTERSTTQKYLCNTSTRARVRVLILLLSCAWL